MDTRKEIENLQDIQLLVDSFYGQVRENELIGPIFSRIIQDKWPEHLTKMYKFWQTVLLSEHTYYGSPFPPHAKLTLYKIHFDTWLGLWHQTLDTYFVGPKVAEAKMRGDNMAVMFLSKIEYYRDNPAIPLA